MRQQISLLYSSICIQATNTQIKATALKVAAFDKLLALVVKVNCSLNVVK